MNKSSDRDRRVLTLIQRRASIREMASDLDVAVGTIQAILRRLERAGLMTKPGIRLARMRKLTRRGRNVLRTKRYPGR